MVSAGFGVWRAGKCTGFAKWSSVDRIVEHPRDFEGTALVDFDVHLADGSHFEMPGNLPGSQQFAAEARSRVPRAFTP